MLPDLPHTDGHLGLFLNRLVKSREIFRRNGEVGIQDHQHISGRFNIAEADGVTFADTGLAQHFRRGAWKREAFRFGRYDRRA